MKAEKGFLSSAVTRAQNQREREKEKNHNNNFNVTHAVS